MTKFQIIVTALFVFFIVVGVAVFATYKGGSSADTTIPPVSIWGTFPQSIIVDMVRQANLTRPTPLVVNYTQFAEADFDKGFIDALASGKGPDAILVPQDVISRYSDKITEIPSSLLSQRDFMNTYIPQAELYLNSTGSIAIPFAVDPLVMYWNRDTFTNAGIATPPKYWQDFPAVISKIDVKDANSNIQKSALALGEFVNITNAREILSALLLQAGNPITAKTTTGLASTVGDGQYQGSATSLQAVNFFAQYANPQNQYYSWNRGLPASKSWFLSGNLATYFGFASELYDIRNKNPNLNFDVAPFPQAQNGTNRVTYGNMYGFSIAHASPNQTAAYSVIQILTTPAMLSILGKDAYLPPVRRDMIATGSTDPYLSIFDDSALIAQGWLDTDPDASAQIFQTMVESITSGVSTPINAVNTANGQLDLSLQSQ